MIVSVSGQTVYVDIQCFNLAGPPELLCKISRVNTFRSFGDPSIRSPCDNGYGRLQPRDQGEYMSKDTLWKRRAKRWDRISSVHHCRLLA